MGRYLVLALAALVPIVLSIAPRAVPGPVAQPADLALVGPSAPVGACGVPVAVVGNVAVSGSRASAFTNALVYIPSCQEGQALRLSATEVDGVGVAATLTSAYGLAWYGVVAESAPLTVMLDPAQGAWLSFTNDLQRGAEDRNLFIELELR